MKDSEKITILKNEINRLIEELEKATAEIIRLNGLKNKLVDAEDFLNAK